MNHEKIGNFSIIEIVDCRIFFIKQKVIFLKMKIYSMYLYQKNSPDSAELKDKAQDFSNLNFMYRKNAIEIADFAALNLATSPNTEARVSAEEKNFLFHILRNTNGAVAIIVADKDYPSRAAFSILREIMDEYINNGMSFKGGKSQVMQTGIVKYQDPTNADKILKIQSNLEETKQIMVQNLEKALGRGESLEDMLQKSKDISASSQMFAREAKKTNKCCG